MNKKGLIWKIVAAVLVIGAVISAIIVFRDEISDFIYSIKLKCEDFRFKRKNSEEFSDYADV